MSLKKEDKNFNIEESHDFDKKNKIIKLKLMIVIVDREQDDFFLKGFSQLGISASFEILGKGTVPKEIYDFLGIGNTKKAIIIGIVPEPEIETVKKFISNRFNVSKQAKGVAFTTPIDSMIGVIIYKFLTDSEKEIRKNGRRNRKQG